MIQGLQTFKEFFKDFQDDYVIIGGLATAMIMNELDFVFRATKDIDMVIISNNNEKFIIKLLDFIDEAGYKTKQRSDNKNKHNLFRFLDSDDKNYPFMIELFAKHSNDSVIMKDNHIVPIQNPENYKYLSAILLDDEYFSLLVDYTRKIDGLHIATQEVLIPLKIFAYLNLVNNQQQDYKKHFNDVIKLISLLDEDDKIILTNKPLSDMQEFLQILEATPENRIKDILYSANILNITRQDIIDGLINAYGLKE